MDKGQVIGLAVILNREFPVAVQREGDRGIRTGMDQRFFEFAPAVDQGCRGVLECRRLTTDIDKDDIPPDMRAHGNQRQVAMVDAFMAVDAGTADMRRAAELTIQIIGPGVIGAGDRPAKLLRLVDQDHAAMPADILEHLDLAGGVAHHQQRHAEEFDRLYHAGSRNVLAEADRGPAVAEQGFPFMAEHVIADVTGVGQAIGTFDG